MKRLVRNVSIFIILLQLPFYFYVEYFSMNFMNLEYPMWQYQKDIISGELGRGNPGILILGDSRTMAGVIPSMLSSDARSLSVGGSSPVESYYMLRNYLKNHKKPETIFLSFSPFHFEKNSFFWERTVKFKLLSISEEIEILQRSRELNDYVVAGNKPILLGYSKALLYRMNFFYYYLTDIRAGKIYSRRSSNIAKFNEMDRDLGFTRYGTKQSSGGLGFELEQEKFTLSALFDYYMRELLDLCKAEGIMVIYETLPVNEDTFKAVTENYVSDYRDYIKRLKRDYAEFIIDDGFYNYTNDYFGDPNHLNKRGSERLTLYLKDKYAIYLNG